MYARRCFPGSIAAAKWDKNRRAASANQVFLGAGAQQKSYEGEGSPTEVDEGNSPLIDSSGEIKVSSEPLLIADSTPLHTVSFRCGPPERLCGQPPRPLASLQPS